MALARGVLIAFVSFVASMILCAMFLTPAHGLTSSGPIIAINSQGRPLTGGTVTIVDTATSLDVTADMKANAAGTTDFSATVPQSGIVQFFGSAGAYQITVSSQGVTRVYYVDIPSAATGIVDGDFPSANLPGHLIATASGVYGALKHNLSASVAPTSGDDSGDNYAVGSLWIDTTGDAVYTCVDATLANAVWVQGAGSTVTAGSSLGTGADVYKQLSGTTLQFRSIVAGDGITVAENTDDVTITGPTFSLTTGGTDLAWVISGGSATLRVPDAGTSSRGVVTTGAQTFTGIKTFNAATTMVGPVSLSSTLAVTGTTTLSDDTTISGTLAVEGITSTAGITGTNLTATGNTTLGDAGGDTVTTSGPTTVGGTFTASGNVNMPEDVLLGSAADDVITLTGILSLIGADPIDLLGNTRVTGELEITGVSGSGKAVCVKADGDLGVCSDAVVGGGTCTCG